MDRGVRRACYVIGSSLLWFGKPGDAVDDRVRAVRLCVGAIGAEFAGVPTTP